MKHNIFLIITFLLCNICIAQPKTEMRAVWIATVANIDFPSSKNLTTEQQKSELLYILDQFKFNNINTVILQIRPTADAFYPSALEPWSAWLTGSQGTQPLPYYDPLQFAIEQAHQRCMELHVWINPYRASHKLDNKKFADTHLFLTKPELFVKYDGEYYFDPGLDETRLFLNKVVEDIVMRYDIDAIHFDDYFYPYKVAGKEFPDQKSFENFPRGFSRNQKDDWRRNNVNLIISELNRTIKSIKPWVEFGISPFGVWRNKKNDVRGSETNALQNYDDLYADVLLWLKNGWIDYVTPQLYWEIGRKNADYATLARWWSKNCYDANLYIGMSVYRLGNASQGKAWNEGNEIVRQMEFNSRLPEIKGTMFYNTNSFLRNLKGLNDNLRNKRFRFPALCPSNKNIVSCASAEPKNLRVIRDGKNAYLAWNAVNDEGGCQVSYYVVYAFKGKRAGKCDKAEHILTLAADNSINLRDFSHLLDGNMTFVVTAFNKFNYESEPSAEL
ncbi:MAG: family 10 glycosylhydrolase, partial [Paludibacter sp.]|nr:family 10 glycosylhydrolase [Paludibacter sp.]